MSIPVSGVYSQCWWSKIMFSKCQTWINLNGGVEADGLKQVAIGYAEEEVFGFPRIVLNHDSVSRTLTGLNPFLTNATIEASLQVEILPEVAATNLEDENNWFTQLAGDIACEFEEIAIARLMVDGERSRQVQTMQMSEPPDRVPAEEIMQFVPNSESVRYPVWVMKWLIEFVP